MKKLFNTKNLTPNIWNNIEYNLDSEFFLDNKMIHKYLNSFWDDIMNKLDNNQSVLLLFRVRLGDYYDSDIIGNYLTIGKLFRINNSNNDLNKLYNILKDLLDIKDESYKYLPLQTVSISYKIVASDKVSTESNKIINKQKVKTYPIRGYNLPNTMNLKLWGKKIIDNNNNLFKIRKKGSKFIYEIEITQDSKDLIYNENFLKKVLILLQQEK